MTSKDMPKVNILEVFQGNYHIRINNHLLQIHGFIENETSHLTPKVKSQKIENGSGQIIIIQQPRFP